VAEEIAATLEREGPRVYGGGGGGGVRSSGALAAGGAGDLLASIARLVRAPAASRGRRDGAAMFSFGPRTGLVLVLTLTHAAPCCNPPPLSPFLHRPQVSERDKDIRAACLRVLEVVYSIEGDGAPPGGRWVVVVQPPDRALL
jgi:hypothetical protein